MKGRVSERGFHSASVSMCVSAYVLRRSCNLLGYRGEPGPRTGKREREIISAVMERWDAGTALASCQGKGCWVVKVRNA